MNDSITLLLGNRCFLYAYLSRAFAAEPDEAFLGIVTDAHTLDECALLDDEKGDGFRLQKVIAEKGCVNNLDLLSNEYTKLFIGPAKLPAPPWESVYVTGERLLFQESTLSVRQAYRSAGYRAAGYPYEADDHIATELGFMAALALEICEDWAGDRDRVTVLTQAQLAFLHEHLLVWLTQFTNQLETCTCSGSFYLSLAKLTILVCERDVDMLEELLSLAKA